MTISEVISAWNGKNKNFEDASTDLASLLLPSEETDFCCPVLTDWKHNREDCKSVLKKLSSSYCELLDSLGPCSKLRIETADRFGELPGETQGNALKELFSKYRETYDYNLWAGVNGSEKSAAWHALKEKNRDLAGAVDNLITRQELNYQHPSAALFVDTLFELCCGSIESPVPPRNSSNPWLPGHTWILIALKNSGSGDPPGLLLRLRIEKIQWNGKGCGAIYPHPRLAAHVKFSKSFAAGIRNAWAVVKNGDAALTNCDYRWWVTVVEPPKIGAFSTMPGTKQNQLDLPLSQWLVRSKIDGESATLAFALALRSVIKNETLRQDRAATARFWNTRSDDASFGWGYVQEASNPSLWPVGSISNKEQAILLCQQPGVAIDGIVLETNQKSPFPSDIPAIPADTFLDAYREFSEVERWISDFADLRAGRWQELVDSGKQPGN